MGLPMSTSGSTAEAAALGIDEEFILRHGVRGGHGLEVSGSKARARGRGEFKSWREVAVGWVCVLLRYPGEELRVVTGLRPGRGWVESSHLTSVSPPLS